MPDGVLFWFIVIGALGGALAFILYHVLIGSSDRAAAEEEDE